MEDGRWMMDGVSVASSVGYLACNPLILRVSVGSVGVLYFYINWDGKFVTFVRFVFVFPFQAFMGHQFPSFFIFFTILFYSYNSCLFLWLLHFFFVH